MAHKYLKSNKKSFKPIIIAIALSVIAVVGLLLFMFGKGKKTDFDLANTDPQQTMAIESSEPQAETTEALNLLLPWEADGAKQPEDYTWEEFEALGAEEQIIFQNYLGVEVFQEWLNHAQLKEYPWDASGTKQPEDYTWEEFEALTAEAQIAFQNYFGAEAFEEWMNDAQRPEVPWDAPGAKQPKDYTQSEFMMLNEEQQMVFQQHMGVDAFELWLNQGQVMESESPWDGFDTKEPEDYTLEEFQSLDEAQQMAFQQQMGAEAFEAWLNEAQFQQDENPWEISGAKLPADYTMEEFEELTGAQQIAFQNYLGSDAFEAWLNKVLE